MTDSDLLKQYRSSLADVHMTVRADVILARGDRRRHQRRVARWAAAGGSGVVALGVAVVLLVSGSSAPHGGRTGAQLTAFTLSRGPGGAATLTLHTHSITRLDPEQLRQALAQRGITAIVKIDSWCDTTVEPAGLHQAVTIGKDSNGDPTLTIQPSAIPTGAELSIGYFTSRTVLALIQTNAPQTCAASPRQAASEGQGNHEAIVITDR